MKTYHKGSLVFERWALVEVDVFVFTSSDHSEGSDWTIVDGVNELAMA